PWLRFAVLQSRLCLRQARDGPPLLPQLPLPPSPSRRQPPDQPDRSLASCSLLSSSRLVGCCLGPLGVVPLPGPTRSPICILDSSGSELLKDTYASPRRLGSAVVVRKAPNHRRTSGTIVSPPLLAQSTTARCMARAATSALSRDAMLGRRSRWRC